LQLVDYTETIFDFLVANWDQTTFPADIIYQKEETRDISDKVIQLKLQQGNIGCSKISTYIAPNKYDEIIHIFLKIQKQNEDWEVNQQYLREVQRELEDKLTGLTNSAEVEYHLDQVIPNSELPELDYWVRVIHIA